MNFRACPVCGQADPAPQFRKDGYDMVRCGGCGTLYVGQDPATIDFDALYGEAYYTGGSDAVSDPVRRVSQIQTTDLAPDQAQALADALVERARPENARYRYDYFTSNCSTQVRDALDAALGGRLKSQLAGRSRGNTFRSEAVRLASPATWMWLGFDVGLGPSADKPMSRWEEAYVPMRLADSRQPGRWARVSVTSASMVPARLPAMGSSLARTWISGGRMRSTECRQ